LGVLFRRARGKPRPRTYLEVAQNSYVYDEQGKKLGELPVAESRETVDRDDRLGEPLPEAVVAVEDRRFYEHFGGSGAAWTDLRAWEVQGAARSYPSY
jgi:membrane peptidoglycan carboxypeptidase